MLIYTHRDYIVVSWKIPAGYTGGDRAYYDPSWLIAENLDQNSLADAFKKFPVDADQDRSMQDEANVKSEGSEKDQADASFELEDEIVFSDDEESDGEEDDEEEEDDFAKSSDELQEYDDDDDDDDDETKKAAAVKDPGISHLEESDYDSPGTVELVLNRRTYRVGQSYYDSPSQENIFVITMILPIPRKAKGQKYMRLEKSFVCPQGHDGEYVLMNEEVTLDLGLLKLPCKTSFRKFSMKYEEEESQRSFAYYNNDTGKVHHHPTGRPTVCECMCA